MTPQDQIPTVEEQQEFILAALRRLQPAAFVELLDATGFPDSTLAVRLDEMLLDQVVMETRGVSQSYYSIWREVAL
jgi:hypothetical protein